MKKKLFTSIILLFLLPIIAIIGSNYAVNKNSVGKIYNSASEIPYNKVGLVLGTGKFLSNGSINLYYQNRIDATLELYEAEKIKFVIISGDNSSKDYDEPSTFKNDLIKLGIPEDKIILDYAGFRTLDSIIRCQKIFGQDKFTIISQEFHNQRALYIANKNGIDAIAFNAKDVNVYYGIKTQIREKLARVKMMIDLFFGKEPKFLGDKIQID